MSTLQRFCLRSHRTRGYGLHNHVIGGLLSGGCIRRYLSTNKTSKDMSSLRQQDLADLLERCGVNSSGTKPEQIERLRSHLTMTLRNKENGIFQQPVLSIDVGYRNMAYAVVSPLLEVLAWQRTEIEVPESYEPSTYAYAVSQFVDTLPLHLGMNTCLVERQRFRTTGLRIIPEPILRGNVVEALLHALVSKKGLQVESVNPIKVARHFPSAFDQEEMSESAKSGKKKKGSHKTKKHNATTLVKALLAREDLLRCPASFQQYYADTTKKDDLSDCLLQAIAWLEWCLFSMQQVEHWRDQL